jgi:2-polyprenyl-3-methyl-5-hydroxy-6-metoxy-1,4-benzoquinol methylase
MKTFSNPAKSEPKRPIPCALCGGGEFLPLWNLEGFGFSRCPACGLVQQNPQPIPESVLGRYSGEYLDYELRNESAYLALELQALRDVDFPMEGEGRSFLDVGCATGALIQEMSVRGYRASGVEVCKETAEYARAQRGLDVRTDTLERAGLAPLSFDFVHASHVIEHLNDPGLFLREARRVLSDSGRLVVTTPNSDGFQAGIFGPRWRSAINDHLYLFSYSTLTRLLEKEGFRTVRHMTWGGWARGAKPEFLKKPLDRLAKRLGMGDVMVIAAEKAL